MRRAVRTPPRAVLTAALLLSWNLFALLPDACAAPRGKAGAGSGEPVRLEEMVIRGDGDSPGVLYRLPHADAPLPPFTPGPDERRESILHDTREAEDAALYDRSR